MKHVLRGIRSSAVSPGSSILDNALVTVTLSPEKLREADGDRYREAQRPELYGEILARPHAAIEKANRVEKGK